MIGNENEIIQFSLEKKSETKYLPYLPYRKEFIRDIMRHFFVK